MPPADPSPAAQPPIEAPPPPAALLNPVPMVLVGAALWLLAAIASFTVADLADWRPVTVAGLGVGAVGSAIFLWQRSAARRGSKGAQTGLTVD